MAAVKHAYAVNNEFINKGGVLYPITNRFITKREQTPNGVKNVLCPITHKFIIRSEVFEFVIGKLEQVPPTSANNKILTLQIALNGVADLVVNWGDGTSSTVDDSTYVVTNPGTSYESARNVLVHEYAHYVTGLEYTVSFNAFTGELDWMYLNKECLLEIKTPFPPLRNAEYVCMSAGNLRKVCGQLYKNNTYRITKLQYAFSECKSLEEIPYDIFAGCEAVTDMTGVFNRSGVIDIPSGLLKGFTNLQYLDFAFSGYYRYDTWSTTDGIKTVKTIPDDLFQDCKLLKSVSFCFFMGGLESVPDNLFADCLLLEDATECFHDCDLLVSVGDNIFKNCAALTKVNMCFYNCSALESIGSSVFENCSSVVDFSQVFMNSEMESIGDNTFKGCGSVTNFDLTFAHYAEVNDPDPSNPKNRYGKLTTIGNGMFSGCVSAKSFKQCFADQPISIIPSGLFADCSSATSFYGTFFNTDITSIPGDLFSGTSIEDVTDCFDFTDITSIPGGLFSGCSGLKTANSTFANCASLVSVPSGLFDGLGNLKNVQGCFSFCVNAAGDAPPLWKKYGEIIGAGYIGSSFNFSNRNDAPISWGGDGNLIPHKTAWETDDGAGVTVSVETVPGGTVLLINSSRGYSAPFENDGSWTLLGNTYASRGGSTGYCDVYMKDADGTNETVTLLHRYAYPTVQLIAFDRHVNLNLAHEEHSLVPFNTYPTINASGKPKGKKAIWVVVTNKPGSSASAPPIWSTGPGEPIASREAFGHATFLDISMTNAFLGAEERTFSIFYRDPFLAMGYCVFTLE